VSEEIQVRRAKRDDLAAIAALVNESSQARTQVDESDVMEWLFSKGLMVAVGDGALMGVVAWQTENLLSVVDLFHLSPGEFLVKAGGTLLTTVEAEAYTLMCEANIVLLPAWASGEVRSLLRDQGYEHKEFKELHRIWREVLGGFETEDVDLMVKRLRERMVMSPL
jgi:hypothetical protein